MIIQNIKVLQEDGTFSAEDLYIYEGRIADKPQENDAVVIDGEGCYAVPGLIDTHFHGNVGYDFCDGTYEAIHAMAKYQLQNGIMAISPATMTLPKETLETIGEAAISYVNEQPEDGADLVGIYMEGPFLSYAKKGAQNPAYLHKADVEMFDEIQKKSGNLIKVCAIAPEEEGALEWIEQMSSKVRCSVAHTTANYDTADKAFSVGASQVTHLYNAMPPFTHREPGVIGAAADHENVFVELICDGVHIHPSVIRATFKLFGDDRIILISDSMMAAGMEDGTYALGGQEVTVKGNVATLADGTIAGSVTNLMDCVRFAVKVAGIPLEKAIKCASANPAKSIGVYENYGSLDAGKKANIILLNEELEIKYLIKDGEVRQ